MLITPFDLFFVLAGFVIIAVAFKRRRTIPSPEPGPPGSKGEVVLTGIALACAGVGPNILVVALTPGMPDMPILGKWALIPSLLVLIGVWAAAYLMGLKRLTNRIWAGIWIGAAATAALDMIRLTGFSMGLMPGNLPRMFGVLLLDRMALGPSSFSDLVGSIYHYWVGASFGLTYTLICGRTRWWGAVFWGLIIELGMMITPPMVIAMDTGYFGLKWGYGILATSVPAHIAFGAVMGVLFERYVQHKGSLITLLQQAFMR